MGKRNPSNSSPTQDNKQTKVARRLLQSWSDIPTFLMSLIFGLLDFRDQMSCRAVCRNWRNIPLVSDLPWLMHYESDNGQMRLINPLQRDPITFTIENQSTRDILNAGIVASNNGWLLLKKPEPLQLLFHSPFTIRLPLFDDNFYYDRATFASDPTSPECIVFAATCMKNENKTIINIWKSGDQVWTTYEFYGVRNIVRDVVYMRRMFYCVFSDGSSGAFDIASHDWRWVNKSSLVLQEDSTSKTSPHGNELDDYDDKDYDEKRYKLYMIEFHGELLLVYFDYSFLLFKFDFSHTKWVNLKGLGNRALFLEDNYSFASLATGMAKERANMIYYYGGYGYYFYYSLNTRKRGICPDLYKQCVKFRARRAWIRPFLG